MYPSRDDKHDFTDMVFALNKMVENNETFAGYKFKEKELELIKQIAVQHGRKFWRKQLAASSRSTHRAFMSAFLHVISPSY